MIQKITEWLSRCEKDGVSNGDVLCLAISVCSVFAIPICICLIFS